MKQHQKWFAIALAAAGGLAIASPMRAETVIATLSDFHNFYLTSVYGNWEYREFPPYPDFPPIIMPNPLEVRAAGYGSGQYVFPAPVNATGANAFLFTFTINTPMAYPDGSGIWVGPNLDISDGTHMVHMMGLPNWLNYGPYVGPGTYTLTGPLTDQFGGADLDVSTITSFNLEFDPAEYGASAPYDITYNNLEMIYVPEPTTLALFASSAAGLLIARRRISDS